MRLGLVCRMCVVYPCVLLLLCLSRAPGAAGQDPPEQDALCDAQGCVSVHFQRKTFRESWRSCRERGGNLATVRSPEEAALIHELLSSGERRGPRVRIRLWFGLQRQPRQCSATRALRGFTWSTGEQETRYTNWQREDLPNTCAAPRCVIMIHNTTDKSRSDRDNFKWLDGSCLLAVDGFMCRYAYRGMCRPLRAEGGGAALYATPFNLVSGELTHVPFGSVATLPCPEGTRGEQSVLCMQREDGTVGWSKDAPLCTDAATQDWCERDNGGCAHFCVNADSHYYCECSEDFTLGDDGQSCQAVDPCLNAACQYTCQPESDGGGYLCTCPDGFLLAPDGQNCEDVDECLQSPCPQLCVNAPGTFECRCHEGYQPSEYGECVDVDECEEGSCEHDCVNTPGSYSCRCHEGFSPPADDPNRCEDVEECSTPGTCQHTCLNYLGGFECLCEAGYVLQEDLTSCMLLPEEEYDTPEATPPPTDPSWLPGLRRTPHLPEWVTETASLDWLTDPPSMEWLPTDMAWFTEPPQEVYPTTHEPDWTVPASQNYPSIDWPQEAEVPSTSSNAQDVDTSQLWGDDDKVSVRSDTRSRQAVTIPPKRRAGAGRLTPPPPPPDANGAEGQSPADGKKRQDKSWLVVALLVPLCVFIVVMLALGIVYCTSCAVEPRRKSVTDCYRWNGSAKPSESNGAKARV